MKILKNIMQMIKNSDGNSTFFEQIIQWDYKDYGFVLSFFLIQVGMIQRAKMND